jgi:hypothetical protein
VADFTALEAHALDDLTVLSWSLPTPPPKPHGLRALFHHKSRP